MRWWRVTGLVLMGTLTGRGALPGSEYEDDMLFALDAIEEECGHFFELKKIDWAAVRAEFGAKAASVETDQDHLVLLVELLARLMDGHASVVPRDSTREVKWPDEEEKTGPGMFWCRIGNQVFVKNSWGAAAEEGSEPGMEVVEVNGEPVVDWIKARMMELEEVMSFSTFQQKFFYTLHWGLKNTVGEEMRLVLRKPGGSGTTRRTVDYVAGTSYLTEGPAFFPEGIVFGKDVRYGKTAEGFGYIQVRRCPGDLNEKMDVALQALGEVPGLVLDFRGNSGGGFDHEAFMGRFIPAGKEMAFTQKYQSSGPAPYGGPVVVIVDATVRSTGETASGILKEDGRAYMIGESATAGMSSSKKTIELPSGKYGLYVSVYSNKARFQGGRGIEGVGVEPHETVVFDAEDLAEGVDTLIKAAEARLKDFPQDEVPYEAISD
jgi:carboxyl-terminal processing protease